MIGCKDLATSVEVCLEAGRCLGGWKVTLSLEVDSGSWKVTWKLEGDFEAGRWLGVWKVESGRRRGPKP